MARVGIAARDKSERTSRAPLMPDFLLRKSFLSPDEQRRIVSIALSLSPGFYVPRTRWGKAMSLRMNCLGQHWSARDYKYHATRADVDQLPCAAIPQEFQGIARRALLDTGYLTPAEYRPFDSCI